jgi:hypothetical protein
MTAPKEIVVLVERFRENREAYRSGHYNETQLRREFVDPFFTVLGWDVDNAQGYAEAYKDVVHEDAIKVAGLTKAPDYGFRVGGVRKFFVETKRPAINIKDDPNPAFQLRRYAWSAKLPLSILTDFEETAVYDCRIRPAPADKPSVARVLYLTFEEYPTRWEEIASIFSREAVLRGSFDRYSASKRRRGTAEVDTAFLRQIEDWRDALAKNLALRNPRLSIRELNFAVQRTIDRIIFLRICEDRSVEEAGRLQALLNGPHTYARLGELFARADDRYNSGLFHFKPEAGRNEPPDELTLRLKMDDDVLKDVVRGLYYPDSPYEFSVLPADILGQVYEQFLGKVIRLTAGHRAKIEYKPEVKKAGGVYYTPTYIVDYIVRRCLGALLEGATPKQAASLRVLDPACGSGSFLIAAYQHLLDWHRDWYVAHEPTNYKKEIYQGPGGAWRLSTRERKRILLNNVFGVDTDPQAVEVTKLSLLLKVLEGETFETLALFHERALPDLGKNIKCGNSLVAPDFYNNKQISFLDDDERYRINAFDWSTEFAEILNSRRGGFDAVIGNPPYGAHLSGEEAEYLSARFEATAGDLDSFGLFMEKAVKLCRPGGMVSMIVPTGWYSGAKFSALRRFIARYCDPLSFVSLPYDIFKAWIDTTVFVARKRSQLAPWPRREPCSVGLKIFPKRHKITSSFELDEALVESDFVSWFSDGQDEFLTHADSSAASLMRKVQQHGRPLEGFADVQRGVTPFVLSQRRDHRNSRPAFDGTVRRYVLDRGPKRFIRFDESLAEPKPERYFVGPRLLLRELVSRQFRLQAVKVEESFVTNKSMQSILPRPGGPSLEYLLGVLNSRLISWYFLRRSQVGQRDDFPKIVLKETRALPIASPSGNPEIGQRVEVLAGRMLVLLRDYLPAKTDHEREALRRQLDATDRELDGLVYELYGVTDNEVVLIENTSDLNVEPAAWPDEPK